MDQLPMPMSAYTTRSSKARTYVAASALGLLAVVLVVGMTRYDPVDSDFVEDLSRSGVEKPTNRFTPAQVGRYGMRAERQARNFEKDSERRYDQANTLAHSATRQSKLSATMEDRARHSAYLAADVKTRISRLLAAGRDQVQRSTQFQVKASKLQKVAGVLLQKASAAKHTSNRQNKEYRRLLDKYSKVVDRIHKLRAEGEKILDSIHAQGIKLARIATNYQKAKKQHSSKLASIKGRLKFQEKEIAKLAQKKVVANSEMDKAKLLMDKYQPVMHRADKAKYNSVESYALYTRLTAKANSLNKVAAHLKDRAESLNEMIKTTEKELKTKRKTFFHYKHRAQLEMHIAETSEDKKEHLRTASRHAKRIAARLEGKAMRVRKLAQKGVDKAMKDDVIREHHRDSQLHDKYSKGLGR